MLLDFFRYANEFYTQSTFSFHLRFLGHDIHVVSALLSIFFASRVIKLLNGIRAVGNLPGYRIPFQPVDLPGALLPASWWNLGLQAHWKWRSTLYQGFRNDVFSVVPFLKGTPGIHTANISVMHQVLSGEQKTSFQKPPEASRALMKWGQNLVSAWDLDMWRKHRRVMGPAFNNGLYEMVWSEMLDTYYQMESFEGWVGKDTVEIPAVQNLSTKLTLLVIAKCGFGFSFDWSAPPTGPDGRMSVQEALRVLADSHIIGLLAPKWVRYLPLPGFSRVRQAFDAFSAFMQKEIEARTADVRNGDERADAFTMLVRANEQEKGKLRLDDQELIGNVFILLFAGHETTAHTFSATLALLALHPDVQNEILEQIVTVVGYDRDPVYDDYSKLDKVLSAFYEALRLFPAAYLLIREAVEDTVLHIPNIGEEERTTPLAIRKGTNVVIDMIGIQYNPRYFEDPKEYRPSRWYGTSNESEAFSAFSIGPRACIGRKFATTEAVVFLTMLLRDWRIEPKLKANETKEEWRERVLEHPVLKLTLGVRATPVRLVRRKERA